MFEWIESSVSSLIVTLTSSSITLNAAAASYFQEVRYCMIGLDKDSYTLGIKPIKKSDVERKIVSISHLHKISNGKGYSRITSKTISDQIALLMNQELINEKLNAIYDHDQAMLLIDLRQLKKEGDVDECN